MSRIDHRNSLNKPTEPGNNKRLLSLLHVLENKISMGCTCIYAIMLLHFGETTLVANILLRPRTAKHSATSCVFPAVPVLAQQSLEMPGKSQSDTIGFNGTRIRSTAKCFHEFEIDIFIGGLLTQGTRFPKITVYKH